MVKFPNPIDQPKEDDPRYAVYFAPAPDSPLHEAGSAWLGRDAVSGEVIRQPEIDGMSADWLAALTDDPRRYGFHATLKPPFRLKRGSDLDGLKAAAQTMADGTAPFSVRLVLRRLSGFFALMQAASKADMRALADAAVRQLDGFRALPGEAELERRRKAGLSGVQESLLQRWGYPYVMSEFRFHMTLSHRITDEGDGEILSAAMTSHFAGVLEMEHAIDAVTLFRQERSGEPFLQIARFPLGGQP